MRGIKDAQTLEKVTYVAIERRVFDSLLKDQYYCGIVIDREQQLVEIHMCMGRTINKPFADLGLVYG